MGQRHQLFVIAKIANRYRGLAVFHHQWLYGARALKQCLALLAIFSAPANRLAILQELAAARLRTSNRSDHKPTRSETRIPQTTLESRVFEMSNGEQVEVRPLPEELFTTAKEMLASSAGPPAP